ncbi:MAG: shikimate dehydrogenase [Saprospiraceae bacterium]|jgi:shikimate dehydrogenase|nr:shikimate dehydrogenase [Saprospiraceae bacterium]
MRRYGLIGYPLGHSFSKRFFEEKFAREGIADARYDLFPLPDIRRLPELIAEYPDLCGLNVTIPHKQTVMRFLHKLDETTRAVGAVNTIRIRDGRLTGFNTDVTGFEQSLANWPAFRRCKPARACILGTGGAAGAVAYVLRKMQVGYVFVSRQPAGENQISYEALNALSAADFDLIVNTTPLGMYPEVDACPPVPFGIFDARHLVYDLVYNPAETVLLRHAGTTGASVKNGLEMLHLQAEAAWNIWQERPNQFNRT